MNPPSPAGLVRQPYETRPYWVSVARVKPWHGKSAITCVRLPDEMRREPGPRRATAPLLKDLNERTVLEAIRAGAPISRAEISRRVGISKPTVSLALQSLLDAGLVREATHDPAGPSYGAVFFEPVDEAALVLGIDVGARFLRGALCDLGGGVRARHDVEGADAQTALAAVAAAARHAGGRRGPARRRHRRRRGRRPRRRRGADRPRAPRRQRSRDGGPAFGAELEERLGVPVRIDNDINLAALGEQWRGVARGVDDFAFLSIGTGLGAGLVLHGELLRGRHGAAGELDFVAAGAGLDIDPCAAAVSALAARLAGAPGAVTALTAPFDVRGVFEAARRGDERRARGRRGGGAPHRAAHRPAGRRHRPRARRAGRRPGRQRRPPARAGPRAAGRLGALSAPRRGVGLGEAAVLTGALSVGVGRALDSVFDNRARPPRDAVAHGA